jgi:hypothetical protein
VSRTIWVPDYGASGSLYLPMETPEPGEPGYLSPAGPLPVTIAREQAIEEALSRQAEREQAELAELEAGG